MALAVAAASTLKAATKRSVVLPRWWLAEALCIHRHESTDWHRVTDWLGRPSVNHGGMQINVGTWVRWAPNSFPHEPAAASPQEQLIVAYRIWTTNGDRFGGGQWPLSVEACHVVRR